MKIKTLVLTLLISNMMSAHAQFGGLLNRNDEQGSPIPASDMISKSLGIGNLSAEYDKTILEIGIARQLLLQAQITLAEALGVKEQADEIASAAGVLAEGGVVQPKDVNEIEKSINVSRDLSDLLETAAESAGELDDEAKEKFAEGKMLFGQGLLAEAAQIAVLVRLTREFDGARGQIRRNPLRLRELIALSVPTVKLASLIPGDVREMRKTNDLIKKIGESNQIDVEEINIDELLTGAE